MSNETEAMSAEEKSELNAWMESRLEGILREISRSARNPRKKVRPANQEVAFSELPLQA